MTLCATHHPYVSPHQKSTTHDMRALSPKLPPRTLTVFVQPRGVDLALEEECGAYI
jgi:hypothetical protein